MSGFSYLFLWYLVKIVTVFTFLTENAYFVVGLSVVSLVVFSDRVLV